VRRKEESRKKEVDGMWLRSPWVKVGWRKRGNSLVEAEVGRGRRRHRWAHEDSLPQPTNF